MLADVAHAEREIAATFTTTDSSVKHCAHSSSNRHAAPPVAGSVHPGGNDRDADQRRGGTHVEP
jgi:hypothetical protein